MMAKTADEQQIFISFSLFFICLMLECAETCHFYHQSSGESSSTVKTDDEASNLTWCDIFSTIKVVRCQASGKWVDFSPSPSLNISKRDCLWNWRWKFFSVTHTLARRSWRYSRNITKFAHGKKKIAGFCVIQNSNYFSKLKFAHIKMSSFQHFSVTRCRLLIFRFHLIDILPRWIKLNFFAFSTLVESRLRRIFVISSFCELVRNFCVCFLFLLSILEKKFRIQHFDDDDDDDKNDFQKYT